MAILAHCAKSNFTQKVSKNTFGGKKPLFSKFSKNQKVSKVFFYTFGLQKTPITPGFLDALRAQNKIEMKIASNIARSHPKGLF